MLACTGGQHLPLQLLHLRGGKPRSVFSCFNRPNRYCNTHCIGSRLHGALVAADSRDMICQATNGIQIRTANKYKGYQLIGRRYSANIGHGGRAIFLGSWDTEEEAARVHDEARIYKDKEPKNFPKSEYQVDFIKGFGTFEAFVQHKRKIAGRQNKTKRSPIKTSRFKGVGRSHKQWRASINRGGMPVSFGCYYSEEDAAKAYDRACIYEEGHAVNFPELAYDKAEILKHASLQDLATASKAFARDLAKIKRKRRGRFEGVQLVNGRYVARYTFSGQEALTRLGAFRSEEQAAQMYDSARILEGKAPVNFLASEYDTHALRSHDPQSFLALCRHIAMKPTKATQHSRFTGVGFGPHRKFTASLYAPKQKKRHLGSFETEEQAARAVDEARVQHGLYPVNFIELDKLS